MVMMTMRSILLVVYNWGEEWIVPFNLMPGGGVSIVIYNTHSDLHLIAFLSGMRKEKKTFLIPLTVDT